MLATLRRFIWTPAAALLLAIATVCSAQRALAHHPFGSETPDTLFAALLSGLGHPVVGIDHLAFVIASGLIAVGVRQGWSIPVGLVLGTCVGTGIHLQAWTLPLPEIGIAASVVLFGFFLSRPNRRLDKASSAALAIAAGVAGIFHGYAYGEAIVGAEPTPLVGYLLGFAAIQFAIALSAWHCGSRVRQRRHGLLPHLGSVIGGAGVAFLAASLG